MYLKIDPYLCSAGQSLLLLKFPLQQQQVEDERLLLPLQLKDDAVGLPHLLLLILQSHRQGLIVQLNPLQDDTLRVTR